MLRWYSTPRGRVELVRAVRHFGWRVECPFCGWRGGSFFPHGKPHVRPNCLCPRCYSKERHRLLYLYLRDRTDLFTRRQRLLEVAPGPYSFRLARQIPGVEHITLDYSDPLAKCRGDLTSLPFPDSSFDLVLCYHLLEHVPEDRRAIAELHRVLRPEGIAILQVPVMGEVTFEDLSMTAPSERLRIYGQDDHVRSYGRDWTDRLREAGFTVTQDKYAASLPASVTRRFGLERKEIVYRCRRHDMDSIRSGQTLSYKLPCRPAMGCSGSTGEMQHSMLDLRPSRGV